MKYIMLENDEGHKIPVLFGEAFVHAFMARHATNLAGKQFSKRYAVASAGFVSITRDGIATFGESESLGIKSNPVDGLRIELGEAVSHMPDFMILPLADKLKKEKESGV